MGTVKLGQSIEIKEEVIKKVCPLAMKAHKSPEKPYLVEKIKTSSSTSSEVVFSFPGSWSVNDWFTRSSFGETKVDLHLFPSLKYIGLAETAAVNEAFFKRFKAVLDNSQFKNEVCGFTCSSYLIPISVTTSYDFPPFILMCILFTVFSFDGYRLIVFLCLIVEKFLNC